jgi:hypothetical protein
MRHFPDSAAGGDGAGGDGDGGGDGGGGDGADSGRLICYPRLLAGTGLLAEHCYDEHAHGQSPGPTINGQRRAGGDELSCGAGRDAEYFEFRNWLMHNLLGPRPGQGQGGGQGQAEQVATRVRSPCDEGAELGVLFDMRSRQGRIGKVHDKKFPDEVRAHWESAAARVKEAFGVRVFQVSLSELPLREQAEYYQKSIIAVTMSGGGSTTSMLLPRGGTLVHMSPHNMKNDFTMWSHVAHIHVDWFEVDWGSTFDTAKFVDVIRLAIARYHQFNDCYDAAVAAPPAHIAAVLGRLSAGR